MTGTEFGKRLLRAGENAFSESLLRHTFFAIREVAKSEQGSEQGSEPGRAWLRGEVKDYWSHRKSLIALLQYLSCFQHSLPTWQTDSKAAAYWPGRWRMIINGLRSLSPSSMSRLGKADN